MVGHQQCAALGGDLLETNPLRTEPLGIDRLVDGARQSPRAPRPTPFVDVGETGVLGLTGVLAGNADGHDGSRSVLLAHYRAPAGHRAIVPTTWVTESRPGATDGQPR